MTLRTLMWALLLSVSVASVPGPVSAQLPPPSTDPCTLLTVADVEQVIGRLQGTPKSSTEERVRICEYDFVNADDNLEVWVFPSDGLERVKGTLKDLKPVTDLGAEAYQRVEPRIGWMELYTRKRDVTIEVTMKSSSGGDLEKAKALARKALSRL